MAWDTVGGILKDVAAQVGLAPATDPFAQTDPDWLRLLSLFKDAGQMVSRARNWTHLQGEYVFTTVAGQQQYPMPPDFLSMFDQSGWVRSTRLPLGGPLNPQEWQFIAARLVGVTWTILFRPAQGAIWAFPPQGSTPSPLTIAFEYQSSWWVQKAVAPPAAAPWTFGAAIAAGAYVSSGGNSYLCIRGGNFQGAPAGVSEWQANTNYAVGDKVTDYYSNAGTVRGSTYYTCVTAHVPIDDPSLGPGSGSGEAVYWAATTITFNSFGTVLSGTAMLKYVWNSTGADGLPRVPYSDAPGAFDDLVLLDRLLMVKFVKLLYLEDVGFDSQAAQKWLEKMLDDSMQNDSFGPVLDLGGRRSMDPLLSTANLPLTGYGQS